ncbi:MAG: hypothetical protein WAV98_00305 [Minisyncoccia bacterium]
MALQSKKTLFIFLSVIFGLLVIFGAAKMAGLLGKNMPDSLSDERWQSELSVIPGSASLTRVLKGNVQAEDSLLQATSTTDYLARKLIVEYALSQRNTSTSTMSDAEATKIANILASEVKLPQKKEYAISDLNISEDNSASAYISYRSDITADINDLGSVLQKENDLSIFLSAISTNDSASLDKLRARVALYQEFIKKLLTQKTPSKTAKVHLRLVQAYETLRVATAGFQNALTNPAVGVAALAEYRIGVDELNFTAEEYSVFFAN